MAWSNTGSTYASNAVPGMLSGIGGASIYDVDSTAKFAIGTGFKRADGNVYRYGNFIGAVAQSIMVSTTTADTLVTYAQDPIVLGTSATQQNGDLVGVYPSLIGSRYILTTSSSAVLNQWAGGYITIASGTGAGYIYRIKGNTAAATLNGVSNQTLIELYEPLVASLATSTYTAKIGCLFGDLVATVISSNYVAVGVTQANMTANSYGWICTHGVTGCLNKSGFTSPCVLTTCSTAGAVITGSGDANPIVGYAIDNGVDGQTATIFVTIE